MQSSRHDINGLHHFWSKNKGKNKCQGYTIHKSPSHLNSITVKCVALTLILFPDRGGQGAWGVLFRMVVGAENEKETW